MFTHRRNRFETLERRLALAVTAAVTDGDLIIQGDADGAVEIVQVAAGSYQVTDDGVLIADATTLQGVNDDIRIQIDATAGADNSVVLNLTNQTVDRVYASLGGGENSLQVIGGTVASFFFQGGDGADNVELGGNVTGLANVRLGNGDNSLTVSGNVGRLDVRGGEGIDTVSVDGNVAGDVFARLGDGDNSFTLNGTVDKSLRIAAGDGADSVTLGEESSVERGASLLLGDGDNTAALAGSIGGSMKVEGLDGNDAVTIASTANIADNLFARLGAGDNTVTHNGSVGGNFTVVSKNANDVVTIADTAVIGGEKRLGLGEQQDRGVGCHGGGHGGEGTSTVERNVANLLSGRGLGDVMLNGQRLGFL